MPVDISRRSLLSGAAAILSSARAFAAKSLAPERLGAELYTVRNLLPKEDDSVLKAIAQIGYKELEGDSPTLTRIAPKAKALGLAMPSCHLPTTVIFGKGDKPLSEILAELKPIGVRYAVVPYIMPADRTAERLAGFGKRMNEAGETAKKAGMQLCYHNHAFEWAERDGKRIFDSMFGDTDPKLVQFEVDVFWLSVAGVDPVDFLTKNAGRVPLVHLKDKAPDQAVQYNENVPHGTFKEVGSGNVDFKGVLAACRKIGVKHYFVEQDWTPGDPVASLRKSYEFVSGLHA